MPKSKDFGLLLKLDYPPYQILCYSNNSFVVCGGGGAAKTGVPNKIELYELSEISGLDGTATPTIENKCSFDSGGRAIMSMRRHFNYLLTAEGDGVCEYILCDKETAGEEEEAVDNEAIVTERRPMKGRRPSRANHVQLELHRRLEPCFSVGAEVSVVRYSGRAGHLVVAGGSEGDVRVLQRYSDDRPMELVLQKQLHDVSNGRCAVIDIDVSPGMDEVVTVCDRPDGKYARVWSISRGVKITELALTEPHRRRSTVRIAEGAQYRFRHCRYAPAVLSGGRAAFLLYATHRPVANAGAASIKQMAAFVSVWGPLDASSGTDYQLVDVVALGANKTPFGVRASKLVPTALATATCGFLAAIGSGEGQVDVYRLDQQRYTLGNIYRLQQAHTFFVTDLAFLPASRALRTGHEFELLSVGVDSMVRYHRVPARARHQRLEGVYRLLSLLVILFFCDRVLLWLSLF